MSLPLADIRVVDFSQVLVGPCTSMFLADQGAEVIKIEPPEGDSSRIHRPIPDSNGLSFGYLALNRNRRNIMLDLTKPGGLEVAYRLVRWADVAVNNLRVSVPQKLHIAYEDLAPINPRLVYASISAYGEAGPDATLPGYDIINQAKTGIMARNRRPDGTPVPSYNFFADMAGAMLAAYAIMVALHERERSGRGQKIELNLLHVYLALLQDQLIKVPGYNPPDGGRRPTALVTPYLCSDGKYLHVHAVTDRQWRNLCRALKLEHLLQDQAFSDGQKRNEQAEALYDILSNILAARPATEWEAILKAANAPCSVVKEHDEIFDDSQVVANQMFAQFQQPGLGSVKVVNIPFRLSGSAQESRFRRHAPAKGEHTVEVLRSLGYSDPEIEALKKEGALG